MALLSRAEIKDDEMSQTRSTEGKRRRLEDNIKLNLKYGV
jgi:hypothetical protein